MDNAVFVLWFYVLAAYKEKMKELSVLSLICSCFYPEPRNKLVCDFEGTKSAESWIFF